MHFCTVYTQKAKKIFRSHHFYDKFTKIVPHEHFPLYSNEFSFIAENVTNAVGPCTESEIAIGILCSILLCM